MTDRDARDQGPADDPTSPARPLDEDEQVVDEFDAVTESDGASSATSSAGSTAT